MNAVSSSQRSRPDWVGAALLIAGITVVARVIGFLRFVVLARSVGTTCLGDVYATANAVPNIVYEVVVGGALMAVVVPLVAGAREQDPSRVRQVVAALHGWALLVLVPVTAVMYLASGLVIELLLGSGGDCSGPDAAEVAQQMLWVFLLQIPVYGLTVIAQGALQAHHRFLAPALAPAISSLVVIGGYLAYAAAAGDDRGSLDALTATQFWLLAGGTTVGVVALLLVQVPALVRARLVVRPSLSLPSGRVAQARTLAWSGAVVVGAQWIGYALAIRWSNTYGAEGSALVFVLAWTLFLLPWAVLAHPVATSTFPRLVALHERGDREGGARLVAQSLRTVVAASALGAAAVAAAASPVAVLVVEGAPGAAGPQVLAASLTALSVGVVAFGVNGHLVRVLAARGRAGAAAWGTASGWAVGLGVTALLVRQGTTASEVAVAIGAGLSFGLTVAALVLLVLLHRDAGSAAFDRVGRVFVFTGLAALVVGVGGHRLVRDTTDVGTALLQVVAVGVVAVVVVGGAALVADPFVLRRLLRRDNAARRDESRSSG